MKKKLLLLFIALVAVSLTIFVACDSGYDCSAGIHNYTVENKCALCGEEWKYSEGLEFELSDDGTYYYVEGIGTCTDTEIVIPYGYNGKPVTSIGKEAFSYCKGLTSVTIGNLVTSIGRGAFGGSTELASVTIGNSVTSIGNDAFSGCDGLTSITVSENNSTYKSIDGNLYTKDGKTLIQYAIGKAATSFFIPNSVTSIGYSAFEDCTGLTSITIPNSVTSIGNDAFRGCTGLMSITIPNSVTSIGNDAFRGCTGLMSVTISDSVTRIGSHAFAWCTGLTSVTIGNSVTSIGDNAFSYCKGLTSVTIGNSVKSIGDDAFSECDKLVEVINKSNLTITAGSSSDGEVGYYALVVHNDDMSRVVDKDGYLFYTHSGVNYLLGYKGTDSELTLPANYNGENYQIYRYAFANCDGLTSVTVGNSVTSIGDWAFYCCTGLASVTIGNSVTSIGYWAFYGCKGLTSVTIGDSVTSIGDRTFYGCRALTSVTIGNSVTSIGNEAFYNCRALTSVTIPDSVTSIDSYAFAYCYGLTSIKYRGTQAQWNAISKGYWNYHTGNYTITYNYTGE